jgi:hypothetical protein
MSGSDWMQKYLDDGKKLSEIIMPGSHDAGVFESGKANAGVFGSKASAICQSGGLDKQLEAGSRFFDLRARLVRAENTLGNVAKPPTDDIDYGRARFFHGGAKTGTKGGGVAEELEHVKAFLKANKGEFCILRFTKTASPNAVENLVNQVLGDVLYKKPGNIAKHDVGGMRGKAIAVFDGTFKHQDQSEGRHHYSKGEACEQGLGVAGDYSASPFAWRVVQIQEDKLKKFAKQRIKGNLTGDRLYTWYQTQTYTTNIKSATADGVGSKAKMHDLSNKLFDQKEYQCVNIVMMDFVDNYKCGIIYRRNCALYHGRELALPV